jgi:3-oxoacyl-[acyl-carrier protein] reductase
MIARRNLVEQYAFSNIDSQSNSMTQNKGKGPEMIELRNKIALVTGGSRGIGSAIARAFAAAGANVVITYKSDKRAANALVKAIGELDVECLALQTSVDQRKSVSKVIKTTLRKFGKIDILVNNAGIWKRGEIGTMTDAQWDETVDTNLKGVFLFCNEVSPIMKRQGSGKIINIASTAGQRGEPFYSHYAASKGGVIAFTKSIGVELAPYGINVNSVAPGWVDTDMTMEVLGDTSLRSEIDRAIPRGKVAVPEDIVGSVLFLASDLSNHIVGATINVNGGSVLF